MAPPDDYGWAYIDPQRASASADGPSGSLQFRYGSEDLVPGQFSGSEDLVFYANNVGHKAANQDGSGSALYLYGNLYVTGAVYAEQYTIRHVTSTEIDISGSTTFGNTNDDNHQISGSLWVSREISGSEALNVQSSSSFGDYLLFHHSITGAAAATAAGGDGDIHVNKVIANDLFVSGSSTLGSGTKNVTTLYGTLTGSTGTDIHINDLIGNDGYFSGSVGIGTTSPARPLHIGDATNTDGNGTIRLQGYSAGGSGNYHEIKSSGDNLEFLRNTTSCLFLKYDGNVGIGTTSPALKLEVVGDAKISGAKKLYFYDTGGEHVSSDGTDLTVAAGGAINLTATTDVVIPANVGVAFGSGEKIEGNNTDLTVTSGGAINLTATTDVIVPADVGITFGSGEKIEGNDTDLTVTSGGAINLTATTDVVLPANVGVTFGSGEKIEGDSTNLTVTSGADINLTATDDINIPANVGLTFGDDGEKIEGDGTDLTIAGNNINLTAVADVNIPSGVGLTFATTEKIESDGTDLTITVGAGGDINIPANIGVTFGDDGEKIEGNGTDLTVAAGGAINLTATTDVVLPADVGITFGSGEKIEGDNTNLTVTSGGRLDLTATGLVKVANNTQLGTDQTDVTTFYGTLTGSQGAGEDAGNVHANKIFANDLYVSGSTTGVSVSYADSTALNIGSSNDLAITHDGTNTKFVNTTGHLWFDNQDADDNIRFDLGTDDTNTKFQIRNNSGTNLLHVLGSGLVSGSGNLAVQGSASFGQPVTISGDLVFHAAATAGVIDIKVNDGSGADTAIQIAKAGKVTKIGDDTPSDGQLLTWDSTAGKVKWDDGVVGISGSSVHYSSTELRTSGELNVSGSSTFAGVATHTAHPIFNTGLTIKNADASAGYINFYEQSSNGTNVCTFRGKSSMGNCTITLPGDTGTVVLEDNTVTLSNKTIASPTITGTTTFSDGDITNVGSIALDTITNDGTDVTIDSSGDIVLDAAGGNIEFKDAGTLQFTIDMDSNAGEQVIKLNVNSDDLVFQQYDGNEVIRIADDRKLYFYDQGGEHISSDGTDLTIAAGADINLTATTDINIPSGVGLTFGNDGEKIEGNGTRLLISSGANLVLDSEGSIRLDSDTGDVEFLDAGTAQLTVDMDSTAGEVAIRLKVDGDDLAFMQYDGTEVIRFTHEGTVMVPESIVHTGDPDTKIAFDGNSLAFHAGTSNQPQMTITTNEVVFNEASSDRDFRIENNGDTHAFYVDGGNADGTNGGMINLAGGYGNGGVAITNSGSLKMDGDLEVDGNATIIGDLIVAGNEIKSNTGNTVFSFDDSGNIDNDVTMQSNVPVFAILGDNGPPKIKMYGPGNSITSGEDLAEIQFYGTEDDGTGNSAQVASILIESVTSSWAHGSNIGSRMVFKVGLDGTTTLHNAMTITGADDQNNTHCRVGINTDSPSHALHVEANGSYDYAGFFKNEGNDADRYGIRIECGQDTMDTTNTLVWFADGNGTFLGKITATGTTVTYGTFTGAHETILENGEILLPYGTILTIKSVTSNVNQPEYVCDKSTAANDKAVLGVYSTNNVKDPEEARRDLHQVNALGDGHILVCSEGGNIETGDYICSSNTAGYGMKQDDDLLHNYTVAKASEPVDWSAETETTKLIACTYHCG